MATKQARAMVKQWTMAFQTMSESKRQTLLKKHGSKDFLNGIWKDATSLEARWLELQAVIAYAQALQDEIQDTLSH